MTQKAATEEGLSNGKDKGELAERAAKTLEKGKELAQENAQAAQEALGQATEQAAQELQKLTEAGTTFVRKNPGAAIAGAVGVGVLLGLALRGRD